MNESPIVIYHANCPDGFGAAWSFWKKFGDKAEYLPMQHGEIPPDVSGRDVYIADFSFSRDILIEMKAKANSMILLDHHKTAQQNCHDLDFCTFDMNSSGAVLAWRFCFPDVSVPLILRYVEDRDLWKWKIPHSREMLAVVDSVEKTFEDWDILSRRMEVKESESWRKILSNGEGIVKYSETLIKNISKNCYKISIGGITVPAVNTAFFQSEVASKLSVGQPFAAAYYYDGAVYRFSLRSSEGGCDVALIAQTYGGGGHKMAAGFSVKHLDELETKNVGRNFGYIE
jgi:oligoribonuclease NrnB/cAMP/cGMP phosphodiesterase (DHH superfamily)